MSKENWMNEVKAALDNSMALPMIDYHDGLIELMEDMQERYQLCSDDLERAEARDEEE